MIPILFPQGTTDYSTNGLGRLADATDCTVTEERNGQYELEMKYPITGIHFDQIAHSKIIYAQPADGKKAQPFRIYSISKPLNGIVEVKAEHISYQMSHIPVSPFTAQSVGSALATLKSSAAEDCPFEFWTDKSTVASFEVKTPSSMRSLLGGQQGSILDIYGGEYEFDEYTVKLHNERGFNRNVTLRYGKNITDIKQEENISNTYTGVMPYWTGTSTDSVSNEEIIVTLPEKVLHSSNASKFPYQRTIPLDLSSSFENQPTVAQLRARAQSYMNANDIGVPTVSIEISFVALWQTEEYKNIANLERVNLCDTVSVSFSKLGISTEAKVVKTQFDVLQEKYKSIELGSVRTNLGKVVGGDISGAIDQATEKLATKTFLQKSVERATKLIAGGLGGYVILSTNADGQPEEILIMDRPDAASAVNVIRMNKNGIGFSTTGYEGPFTSAWTIDGHFVADFIDTGTLQANLIKAGRLQDEANKNFWDMETGEFQLASTTSVGGKTITEIAGDAVDAQTQQDLFNKLTNGGQTQGIYLSNGKLYINASYIATGILASTNGASTLNLSNGTFHIGKGYYIELNEKGQLAGGYSGTQYGYIDFSASAWDIPMQQYTRGIQIQGGMLRISTYRIAAAQSYDTSTTAYIGGNGKFRYIKEIADNGNGTITWTSSSVYFVNGIMVTELDEA